MVLGTETGFIPKDDDSPLFLGVWSLDDDANFHGAIFTRTLIEVGAVRLPLISVAKPCCFTLDLNFSSLPRRCRPRQKRVYQASHSRSPPWENLESLHSVRQF